MEHKTVPNFPVLLTPDPPHVKTLINLEQLRMITNEHDGLRLHFSEAHVVTLSGTAGQQLFDLLVHHSITVEGETTPEFAERIRSKLSKSEPAEDPLRGA